MAQQPGDADRIARNTTVHDRIAQQYDRYHPEIFNDIEQQRLARSLAAAIGAVQSSDGTVRALDMGCGSGNLTLHLLDLGCAVTAADVSTKFLSLVTERFGGQKLTTSPLNGTDLSQFSDCSFDLIATYSVLHHIPDYLSAVREMGRVCRPGGVVYIDHESAEHVWQRDPDYVAFKRRAMTADWGKWLRPINYYGKVRRLFDPKFANEGDIHVWPDDHIEWGRIAAALGDDFAPVVDQTYLLFNGRYRREIYAEYVSSLTDMRVMAFRRAG